MNEIEEIKRRLDIVDLISTYLTLKKAGANYKALCPFHQEKTPSLMISPEKQIWHCFGCSEGGDIFSFVMKMENLEFGEALRMLAERTGVKLKPKSTLVKTDSEKPDKKSRLYQINALAGKVFHKILISHPSGRQALSYLKKRGISLANIKEFQLGFASSSRAMTQFLKKQGFIDEELRNAGSPERFFKRIIFPIRDTMGQPIAFTGRVLNPNQEPKYLNTPETVLFHKSRVLYNLDKARGEIKTQRATVVVEGQMDVIASWQTGIKNVVASSGTALTRDHLQILNRYTPNILFAFDSDSAGLASAKKAYELAIEEGLNAKMVSLGDYKDPGEMIAHSPKLWQEAISQAKSVIDWYFQLAFGKRLAAESQAKEMTSQEKKEIAKEILPVLKKIPDSIEQAHYISLLAKRLAVPEKIVYDALEKIKADPQKRINKTEGNKKTQKPQITTEQLIIGIMLTRPDKIEAVQKEIRPQIFKDLQLAAIYREMITLYNKHKSDLSVKEQNKDFYQKLKQNLDRQLQIKVDSLVLAIEAFQQNPTDFEADLLSAQKILKQNQREALKEHYAREIKKAESAKDLNRLKKLIKEFQDAIAPE